MPDSETNDPVLVCAACAHEADMPDSPDLSWLQPVVARHPVIVHHDDGSHDFMWDIDR